MSTPTSPARTRRFAASTLAVGLIGSAALATSMGATLSGFTASITNSANTAASATLAIEETSGATTCRSYDATATCSTINKYGGTATPLMPGGSRTTTVTFTNVGTANAGSATLAPGACTATSTGAVGATTPTSPSTTSGNLCSVVNVAVYKAATATGSPLYNGSAAGFSSVINLDPLASSAAQPYTFVVSLPTAATTAVQGQQVSQPLVWTFNQ